MKKIIAALLAAFLCIGSSGQSLKGQHEVNLDYGQLSVPQFVYGISYVIADVFVAVFSGGNQQLGQIHFPGAIGFEFNYWLTDRWSIGGSFTSDYMYESREEGGELKDLKFGARSLQVLGKYSWFNYKHCGMYSKLGLGASLLLSEDDLGWCPAFQATLVAVDFGGLNLRGFVELGVGTQGSLLGGIRYRF